MSLEFQKIIEFLENDRLSREERQRKVDEQFTTLNDAMCKIDQKLNGMNSYFIGMDPKEHILAHAKLKENEEMMSHVKKAVIGSVISFIFAVIVAVSQYTAAQAQKDLAAQVAELTKQQPKK